MPSDDPCVLYATSERSDMCERSRYDVVHEPDLAIDGW